MPVITVTFIRHGESLDNPRGIWAGWKDAPLSELGLKQAAAVGKSLASTHIDVIYASPLLRAYATAQAVHNAQPTPQPPLIPNPKLREQHFGVAEGNPWVLELPPNTTVEQAFATCIYPVLEGRDEKFPGAESLDDLAHRAEEAIEECVLPHLSEQHASSSNDFHIAIASHGLCISELVAALLRLDPTSRRDISYAGLLNTAWTRVNVSVKDGHSGPIDINNLPPLDVRVTDVNHADHLNGIPEASYDDVEDPEQAEARAFFGGGGAKAASETKAKIGSSAHHKS